MQFELTETQQTLQNTVRKFLAAECPMTEVRRLMETDTGFDAPLWRKIAEQGWTGMLIPEQYGGFGMGMVEMAATLEEMGRALLPGPFFSTVLMAGALIESAGNEKQKQKYLGAIARGEARITVAFLEDPPAPSPDAIRMTAHTAAVGYVLDGKKLFVPDAAVADDDRASVNHAALAQTWHASAIGADRHALKERDIVSVMRFSDDRPHRVDEGKNGRKLRIVHA